MTILAAVNEWYLGNLSAETAKGKHARVEAGLWNGAVPFGYRADYKKDGGDGVPYPDRREAEGVRMAFEQYATGHCSDNDVARRLNEAGYRPEGRGDRALELFSKDTVNRMLQSRFYLGKVAYKDEWFPGQHEAIISDALFERCQAARRKRRRSTSKSTSHSGHVYPLTGLARCARCRGPLRGSSSQTYRYYRDPARDRGETCEQRMIKAEEAENALGDVLQSLALPEDWQARVLALVQAAQGEAAAVARQQARLAERLERLKDLYLLGDLARPAYLQERDRLQAQLAALTPPQQPDLARAAALLQNLGALWGVATPAERRRIAHTLLNAVYLDADQGPVVAIAPKPEFAPLFALAAEGLTDATAGDTVILAPGDELEEG
jgi:site-specific DNA recombinase